MEWQSWAGLVIGTLLAGERVVRRVIGPPSIEAKLEMLTESVGDMKFEMHTRMEVMSATIKEAGKVFSDKHSETQKVIGGLQLDVREMKTVLRLRGMDRPKGA